MRSRRRLPHVRQERCIYFVTYRSLDSLPDFLVEQWRDVTRSIPATQEEEDRRLALARYVERFLDQPHGQCLLARKVVCDMVRQNLLHNDGKTYLLDAYAIMPTHVHTLVMPLPGADLDVIVASWRKYSARRINEICGTEGSYWSEEPFDHIVRSSESMARFRRYVLDNPTKVPHLHTLSGQGSFAEATGV